MGTRAKINGVTRRARPAPAGRSGFGCRVAMLALLLAPSSPVFAQTQRSMVNGGFESNNPAGNPGFEILPAASVPGWDSSTGDIELWDTNYTGVPAQEGAVFAEMNANSAGALYQSICLTSGETIRWSFAHRARMGGAAAQTALFQIANASGTVQQTLTTQVSTTVQGWNVNANALGVLYSGATGLQRVQFMTTDAGSFGNFLDNVQITLVPFAELSAVSSAVESVANASLPTLLVSGFVPNAFTIPVTVTGGTAVLGEDFTTPGGTATFNVTIPAGNYVQQSIPLGMTIINDTQRELSETIELSIAAASTHIISSTTTCGTAGRAATTYTITDDDTARVAGSAPALICPVGSTLLDWDNATWTAGATSGTFNIGNIGQIALALANPNGAWLNLAAYGGQSPVRQNVQTGGLTPAQFSLILISNFTSRTAVATATFTLPTAVPGAQFRIFDVDFNSGQFADQITVVGRYGGTTVIPTLTNGVANLVQGNSAVGDAASADTSADGNIIVTFTSPVDTIEIAYGNFSTAPADPGQQAVSLHDIAFCNPQARLAVAKTAQLLSDPINGATNAKAIPGAVMRYCLLVTNPGSGTATTVSLTDGLPATMTYVTGSITSASACAGTGTAEDDDAVGSDEGDPFGGSISGTTVSGSAALLRPSESFALRFDATVK